MRGGKKELHQQQYMQRTKRTAVRWRNVNIGMIIKVFLI